MEFLKPFEKTMEPWFKSAPKLSDSARKSFAEALPWLALIFGGLQVLLALFLWQAAKVVSVYSDLSTAYLRSVGVEAGLSSFDKTLIYVGVVMILVDAALLLLAFPKLKNMQKAGWDLLFLASLVNVAYSIVSLFIDARGIGGFLFGLIFSAVGFWLLFQIKPVYKKA
jgi:hypothetical protein